MIPKGTKVKLQQWAYNPDFFDDEKYMFRLAYKDDAIFTVYYIRSDGSYMLESTEEEPELEHCVWREKDLIPITNSSDLMTTLNKDKFKYNVTHNFDNGYNLEFAAGEASLTDAIDREMRYAMIGTRILETMVIKRKKDWND